jgi:hypothetical protein
MADDPTPTEYLVDPLTEITRKERRALVAASAAGILVASAGIVPSEIAALGIKFDPPAQDAFLLLLIGVIVYFRDRVRALRTLRLPHLAQEVPRLPRVADDRFGELDAGRPGSP